jgi:hypothetical protein
MTFKLVKDHTFKWPVRVRLPNDKGKQTVHEFTGHFRLLPADEFERKQREWLDALSSETEAAFELREKLVGEVLIGWEGVVDEDNQAVTFSDEALKAYCRFGVQAQAVQDAYSEALSPEGQKARRRGN